MVLIETLSSNVMCHIKELLVSDVPHKGLLALGMNHSFFKRKGLIRIFRYTSALIINSRT